MKYYTKRKLGFLHEGRKGIRISKREPPIHLILVYIIYIIRLSLSSLKPSRFGFVKPFVCLIHKILDAHA